MRPFQPAPNAHRRLSIQMRPPSTSPQHMAVTAQPNAGHLPSIRLPAVQPPPSTSPEGEVKTSPEGGVKTPLHEKSFHLTLPGEIKATHEDLISALVQPHCQLQRQQTQTGFEPKDKPSQEDENV